MNQEPNGKPSEDKLDRWIEETLHEGVPKKEDKFVHESLPQQPKPQNKPDAVPAKPLAGQPVPPSGYQKPQIAHKPGQGANTSRPGGPGPRPTGPRPGKFSNAAGRHSTGPRRPIHGQQNVPPAHGRHFAQPAGQPIAPATKSNQFQLQQQSQAKPQAKKPFFKGFFNRGQKNVPAQAPATQTPAQSLAQPPIQTRAQSPVVQTPTQTMSYPTNFEKNAPVAPIVKGQPIQYRGVLRLIPLGGLDEVGKNCMAVEYATSQQALKEGQSEIIIIDIGFQFPEEDMLGIDYVIPDVSYLEDKIDRIRGVLLTHGHLDHIGAIPYIIPKLNFPMMFGTRLTMGLVDKRLEEFGLEKQAKTRIVTTEDTLQLGPFNVSFFPVNHSIPDAMGIVVKTPAGNIAHTGDFKFDFTPSGDQKPADFARIASLASQDIAALFIDSTNALKPGYTVSEKKIGESLEHIIKSIEGRVLIASFASQIGRMQQIIDYCEKYHRKIYLSGRSLIDNVFMAQKLGYLRVPTGLVHDIRKTHKLPDTHVVILTTGSQGESVSALTRMALEDHPSIKIKKGDTVVLSSSPIPGNERAISTVMNNLSRLGAKIINNQIMDVHTSGHAQQEDLKLMMSLVKAKAVVPVHGEFFMRLGNRDLAASLGYKEQDTIMVENGGVIEVENGRARATGETVETNYIMVDGLGVGDIGAQVMMDRQTLAENGVLIIMIPIDKQTGKLKGEIDVISRGFIYMKESEMLIAEIKEISRKSYQNILEKRKDLKRGDIKKYITESVDKFVHQKIERHPLVLPVVTEV
ncbi:MAG: RNase J family beta-CASP ribonuclease [Candidatus Gracilibacteria bacterium]|jgi:ribonuclease J